MAPTFEEVKPQVIAAIDAAVEHIREADIEMTAVSELCRSALIALMEEDPILAINCLCRALDEPMPGKLPKAYDGMRGMK